MYIATPEQPASYLFITRTSHLNHTRPQNAPHATHKLRVLLLNARTQPSFDQTDDDVSAETSLSLSLSLHFYLSSPPLHFFLALTFGQYILFENACELQRFVFLLEDFYRSTSIFQFRVLRGETSPLCLPTKVC